MKQVMVIDPPDCWTSIAVQRRRRFDRDRSVVSRVVDARSERWRPRRLARRRPAACPPDTKHLLLTRRRGRRRASRRDASAPSLYARRSAKALSIAPSIKSIHVDSAGIGAIAELTTVLAVFELFAGV